MNNNPLEKLNVLNDFIFNEMICRGEEGTQICRIILRTILGKEIPKVKVVAQRTVQGVDTEKHGIRMDAYIEEDKGELEANVEVGTIYDIEPNTQREKDNAEPKRLRYYHSLIDSKILERGVEYKNLKNVIVIMIMPYDPFGLGRMFYTVKRTIVEEPEYQYEDGATTIFLYTKGKAENPRKELQDMLHYMENSMASNVTNEDLEAMHRLVEEVKRDREVGVRYMQSWEREMRARETGREEGLKEGLEVGVRSLITTCREFSIPQKEILDRIEKAFGISREDARRYMEENKED